jgi:hypothetical protein
MYRKLAVALMLTCIASTTDAQVQSRSEGVFLNAHLIGTSLSVEDADREQGVGLGLGLGYAFRNRLAIYFNADAASMSSDDAEKFKFGHGELGMRYTLADNYAKMRPFIDASAGWAMAWQDDVIVDNGFGSGGSNRVDVEMSGPVFGIGGGVNYFLSPALALAGGVRVGFGKFSEVKIGNITIDLDSEDQPSLTSMRLSVGLAWFPTGSSTTALQR